MGTIRTVAGGEAIMELIEPRGWVFSFPVDFRQSVIKWVACKRMMGAKHGRRSKHLPPSPASGAQSAWFLAI